MDTLYFSKKSIFWWKVKLKRQDIEQKKPSIQFLEEKQETPAAPDPQNHAYRIETTVKMDPVEYQTTTTTVSSFRFSFTEGIRKNCF